MRNFLLAATLALAAVAVTPAYAQSADVKTLVTGSSLYTNCSAKTETTLTLTGSNALAAINYCGGFIAGAIASNPAIQLPNGVTFGDAQEIIVSYLAQHPERRYLPAAKLIEDVLIAAYPAHY